MFFLLYLSRLFHSHFLRMSVFILVDLNAIDIFFWLLWCRYITFVQFPWCLLNIWFSLFLVCMWEFFCSLLKFHADEFISLISTIQWYSYKQYSYFPIRFFSFSFSINISECEILPDEWSSVHIMIINKKRKCTSSWSGRNDDGIIWYFIKGATEESR